MKKNYLPLSILTAFSFVLPLAACNQKGDVSSEIINAKYTVTFNACANIENKYTYVSGETGEKVTFPKDPSVSGRVFLGWSTSYNSSKKWGDENSLVDSKTYKFGESNVTLYASYAKQESHTEAQVDEYMNGLKSTSQDGHLYYHYYRYLNNADSYADWDVWAWPYKPTSGQGYKFDWNGRTTSSDKLSATGDANVDSFGGAYVDIDLKATYDGGWDNTKKKIGGTTVSFDGCEQVGLQIVQSSTRTSSASFWTNDGSNLYIKLEDYAMELDNGGTAYHVFVIQNLVQSPMSRPSTSDVTNPFDEDDGTNTTYGDNHYDNVDWSSTVDKTKTAEDFLNIGVGYQIMVSSFADSDGDGFGDIYGITQKLDYLEKLGVKALWLTPIQLSDSYHGYDISDYEVVDPKFGSTVSTAAVQNNGVVDSTTAMNDYKELINAAHAKGMKVVMDLVLNHTSTSNKWFTKSANLDSDYRGFYQWGNHEKDASNINEDKYWYPYSDTVYSYYAKFGSAMPELNYSYKSTREAVEEMSVFWAEDIGVDGFRLDAVKHIYMTDEISSTSGDTIIYDKVAATSAKPKGEDYSSDLTKNLNFFKELKKVVTDEAGRDVFFVGENFDGHAYHVAPYYEAFDSMFDFYTYYNLTSAAATGRYNTTSKYGTASSFMGGTGTYTVAGDNTSDKGVKDGSGIMSTANNSKWNYPSVYNTYKKYRGDTPLPGSFTSNHDIARVINRIAGSGNSEGIQAQGNVTDSTYDSLEMSANCVKIAEIMFPGLTWVYYGDEIGMTGNWIGDVSSADDGYADLSYRQPMKWVDNGVKGDGSYTTDYDVTGTSIPVTWDSINSSSKVKGAMSQIEDSTSQFSIIKSFIDIKNGNNTSITNYQKISKTLIQGDITYSSSKQFSYGNLCANVLSFERVLDDTTIQVAVNLNGTEMPATNLSGTVIASYNGATTSTLPAYSVVVTVK